MNNKVLIVSFSFEQEPDAFRVLIDNGFEPILWARSERGEKTIELDLIQFWNNLKTKPSGILMGADVPMSKLFFEGISEQPEAISLNCAGYDHLDLDVIKEKNIRVCNVPRQNFSAVADLAFGLMISVMRQISRGDRNIRAGKWSRGIERGIAVSSKTLGILGFGAIGQAIARRGIGFDMTIIAYTRTRNEEALAQVGAKFVSIETLFRESDILVVTLPATAETYHIIDHAALSMMKKQAIIINPSRGTVIDTSALVEALKDGTIAGAGLDVYEEEPLFNSPLFELENTVLTPHIGGLADREIRNVAMKAAWNMVALLNNTTCEHRIL